MASIVGDTSWVFLHILHKKITSQHENILYPGRYAPPYSTFWYFCACLKFICVNWRDCPSIINLCCTLSLFFVRLLLLFRYLVLTPMGFAQDNILFPIFLPAYQSQFQNFNFSTQIMTLYTRVKC